MGLSRRAAWSAGLLLLAAVLAVGAGLLLLLFRDRHRCDPPRYRHAAVAADTLRCSEVGRDILKHGGSAVDAAIAALVCTSVLNPQSMGLGGGVIFTIYDAPTGKIEVLNARERAPQNITEGLLKKCGGTLLPGGTLTLEDLKNYRVELMKPVNMSLDKYTIFSAPRPAAGAVLFFILNVLKGFNFTKVDLEEPNRRTRVYHYIAETLKFANGQRAKLDDPTFSKINEEVLHEMISDAFADHIRQLIDDRGDHPTSHYDPAQLKVAPFGTSHVAVLAEDGSAVSATSTINHPFGSMVYSQQTGIILNNELADFCMKQSSKNIFPGEMPPSAMTPSILLSKDGRSKLIIGGSGGPLIIPAVAQAIVNKLWFGYDLDQAIGAPILSATRDGSIQVEKHFPQNLTRALISMGHSVHPAEHDMNVVQGISQEGFCIFPYSDRRKQGEASGY
ncbi:PREDICTED: gamma-glutamyltransferase 5 isoform X2 [Thamnophis sirtalis]|uniref:Gamma-glutamyltransferase 5 isoform X2 n=1 Tax=Thamnophis sirtalis TaxID=35019 RepID=A0A6I9YL23_9SAUR|nr:PREDICTED: gamma-glutamyltransferase 5 isoform X2 [Thamnophis sirtalis]